MSQLHHKMLEPTIAKASKYIISNKGLFPGLNVKSCHKTMALTLVALEALFSLDRTEALECITEGGGDNGIDAIYIQSIAQRSVFHIFQTKHKHAYKQGFDTTDIFHFVNKFRKLEAGNPVEKPNPRLKLKWEEVTAACAVNDDYSYKIHFLTNGVCPAQDVKGPLKDFNGIYDADFYGAKELQEVLNGKEVKDEITVKTYGNEILEQRIGGIESIVCVLPANEVANIYEKCGKEKVLQSNVRYYLGKKNKVNQRISDSAENEKEAKYFWFQNNGLSIICDDAVPKNNPNRYKNIKITNPVIVNGGQTTRTLYELRDKGKNINFGKIFVTVRIIKTSSEVLINQITRSTNNQSPISTRDLSANDPVQNLVKNFLRAKDIYLETKRNEYAGKKIAKSKIVKNNTVLQFYVSIHKKEPSEAKKKSKVFEKYFDEIFTSDEPKLFEQIYKVIRIYDYIRLKERELIKKHGFLGHANLAIAYLIARQINVSRCSALSIERRLPEPYKESLKILAKIVRAKQKKLGENYSHSNLFKGGEIVGLMNSELSKFSAKLSSKKK